jgi:hypothetical protein
MTDDVGYTQYEHHGKLVWVRADLRGRHREHCLCFSCARLDIANPDNNCDIARSAFQNCVQHGIVTPMWECPYFCRCTVPAEGAADCP